MIGIPGGRRFSLADYLKSVKVNTREKVKKREVNKYLRNL